MRVIDEVNVERIEQRRRWGAKHDSSHSWWDWKGLIGTRMPFINPGEDPALRRRALIELAALAIAAVEANE